MKKLTLLTITFLIAINLFAAKPPEKVLQSFRNMFPQAEKVNWSMEKNKDWEAEFVQKGTNYSANFNKAGKWLETETEIRYNELPALVAQGAQPETGKSKVKKVYRVDLENGESRYEIEITVGKRTRELLFNADGTRHVKK